MEHYFHKWTYQIQALHLCVVSALYLIVIHRYVVVTVVSWLADMHAHTRSKVDRYTITSLWLDHWSTIDRPLTDTFVMRDTYVYCCCLYLTTRNYRRAKAMNYFRINWTSKSMGETSLSNQIKSNETFSCFSFTSALAQGLVFLP